MSSYTIPKFRNSSIYSHHKCPFSLSLGSNSLRLSLILVCSRYFFLYYSYSSLLLICLSPSLSVSILMILMFQSFLYVSSLPSFLYALDISFYIILIPIFYLSVFHHLSLSPSSCSNPFFLSSSAFIKF